MEQQAQDQALEIQGMSTCCTETKPEGNHVGTAASTVYGASIHLVG